MRTGQPKPMRRLNRAGFTLVEIALALAIIGFALVAIIGVLPAGVTVQKENREETIINQDGRYLLEAIRSGSQGIDDLTNYVESIIITNVVMRSNGAIVSRPPPRRYTNDVNAPLNRRLANGAVIVGLLTTPKLRVLSNGNIESNTVAAYVRSMTGVASEKSLRNQGVKDFAFRYLVRSEVIPFTQPPVGTNDILRSIDLANNLHDLRLTLNWPLFQRGDRWEVGFNRKTFRTLVAGEVNRTNNLLEPSQFVSRY
jgi:prepilin-type N-terminal cleavage/methylation domain-containing protein